MNPGYSVRIVSIVLGIVFVAPITIIFGTSLNRAAVITFPPTEFSLTWYKQVLSEDRWIGAAGNSLVVALLAAALATATGVALAYGAARGKGFPPAGVLTGLAIAPMIIPPVVAALGYYAIQARVGLVGTALGVALAHAMLGVPFVYLNVLASLRGVPPNVEDAARVAGSSKAGTIVRIVFPLTIGAILVGSVLAFVQSWDEVIIANFLVTPDFRTLPVELYTSVRSTVEPSTSAVAVMATLLSFLILLCVSIPVMIRRTGQRLKGRHSKNADVVRD